MEKLVQQLRIPKKFEGGDNAFWQDPYISKQLLKAHLNPNVAGASRSFQFIDTSVQFIQTLLADVKAPKIIDFGCGPGLYCERLAKKGYEVTGIDFSENSIRHAKEHAIAERLAIQYFNENYLTFRTSNDYDLALLIYCDYGALCREKRKKLLENIWHQLAYGGKLLLDVYSQQQFNDFQEEQRWEVYESGGFWSPERHVVISRNCKYEENVSLEQVTVMTENRIKTYFIWHQYFTIQSILHEVKEAGFTVKEIYKNVAGERYMEEHQTMALLLVK